MNPTPSIGQSPPPVRCLNEVMGQPPTIGRIVGYVLPLSHRRAGEVVPAIITRIWPGAIVVQLTPFVDVANDAPVPPDRCSSVPFAEASTQPYIGGTWHWLPRA